MGQRCGIGGREERENEKEMERDVVGRKGEVRKILRTPSESRKPLQ